jgi:hypothetical protein
MQNLHQSTCNHEILYADFSSKDEKLIIGLFKKISTTDVGWKSKVIYFFYGDNSGTVALIQTKFGTVQDHGHNYNHYSA